MDNLPVIIAEVSVAPSGDSFRNTFFCLRMFQTFYRRFYQNTTNHVMGSRADHDKSRYEAYSVIVRVNLYSRDVIIYCSPRAYNQYINHLSLI